VRSLIKLIPSVITIIQLPGRFQHRIIIQRQPVKTRSTTRFSWILQGLYEIFESAAHPLETQLGMDLTIR
jgi:hypothetical protein